MVVYLQVKTYPRKFFKYSNNDPFDIMYVKSLPPPSKSLLQESETPPFLPDSQDKIAN